MPSLPAARLLLATAACSVLALAWNPGQGRFDEVEISAQHVSGTVHMLKGAGGNIGACAGPEGVVLIDDQFEPLAPKIQAALEVLSEGPLRYVLNTHHHSDHTGGNPVFGRKVPILAHANVRRRLAADDATTETMLAHGLPVITYDDGLQLFANGEVLRVVHYPACHTDGDSVVFFEHANVVHMGDMFFAGRFPYVDLDAGGSVKGLIAAVTEILAGIDDETRIIPGHGSLSSKQDLADYLEMLTTLQARVAAVLAEGATVQDMLRDDLFSDYAEWGTGFINTEGWVHTLAREAQGD